MNLLNDDAIAVSFVLTEHLQDQTIYWFVWWLHSSLIQQPNNFPSTQDQTIISYWTISSIFWIVMGYSLRFPYNAGLEETIVEDWKLKTTRLTNGDSSQRN